MDCVPRPPARKHWFYPTNTCTHVRKLEVSLPILVESYVEGWNCNATQCNQVQVGVQGINPKVPRRDSLAVDARQIRQTGTASEGGHVCPGQGAKSRFPGCGNLHISQTNIGQMHRFNPIWPNLAPTWRNLAPSWTRLGATSAQVELHMASKWGTWPAQYEIKTTVFIGISHVFWASMTLRDEQCSPSNSLGAGGSRRKATRILSSCARLPPLDIIT